MAVLYSPDTKVPRTGELALRRAIPANTSMKAIQVVAEILVFTFFLMITINFISQTVSPSRTL